ncbi:protein POLAR LOCALIZATION DURING ASYMMETRIC DIVISION AND REDISTRIBUTION [Dendrobium catenatum]|uniref:Protein POLAR LOCALIZATION DURING ASYMMETRIC DIVISION AND REDISTRIBUTION n=1 Tax=Dendrobium catenatum TaxID=906689 RepID=A0A2I0W0A3_9ASPA|nr:protein POLAR LOCALIZATION DURING ASYMMETRIC DIVISION AND REDISTRIBUTION [Dendrobium catenatum]PKU69086.1 hypothetical protein MA16_Dca002356 [Dendrobium catenatum]
MRIADVLRERDDGDDGISGENFLPSFSSKSYSASPTAAAAANGASSWSILFRWFRNRRKRAPAASGGKLIGQWSATDAIAAGSVDSGGRLLPEIGLSSGVRPNEIAFNLGMGIGLAFLLAGNTNEMNKMVELRNQMEMLLKEIKGEVQRRDDNSLYTSSDVSEDAISTAISIQQNSSSLEMEDPKHFSESNRENYQSLYNLRGMVELEAELQLELERMQLKLGEDAGEHKMKELKSKKVDLSSGSSASAWYDHMPDENSGESHGICAYDLERRLHELLQTRQQERIESLESALELAQRKLQEKEEELCCWKNIRELATENDESYFSLSFK